MADFFNEYQAWLGRNGDNLQQLLSVSGEMFKRLRGHIESEGLDTSIATLINDDAVTVRAMLDGLGLAEIAGQNQLSPESIIEALGMTLKMATLIGAFA